MSKSYSPDQSAEFAGGLVQIVPMKLRSEPVARFRVRLSYFSTATGKTIPLSPLGSRDVWGYDDGARALPAGIPADKIVRQGIYTPDVGYSANEITEFGRLLENRGGRSTRRRARAELERDLRQSVREVRHRRQRHTLLQGAVRRRRSAILPHRRRR